MPEVSLHGPRRVLDHHPIPIEVLERLPLGFPIGIIRGDTLKPGCNHPGTTGFPLVLIGEVEDQQMILCGRFTNMVSTLSRELQMVVLLGMPKDNAIEAIVVVKLGEYREVQPGGIHFGNSCQMVGGSSNAEYSTSLHRSTSSSWSRTPGIRCTRQRISSLPW